MMSKTTILLGVLMAVGAGVGVGCKGDKVIQDNPQTLDELARCKKNGEEQAKLIKALEDEKARTAMGSAAPTAPGEIVVAFENSILTVRPGKAGAPQPPVDNAAAKAASQDFINLVAKSRGSIQKCYEQALKKDTSLQARTVTLTVSASFTPTGAHKSSTFSPSLGDSFDSCMQTIAAKWQMPANVPISTFRAPVSLTPS